MKLPPLPTLYFRMTRLILVLEILAQLLIIPALWTMAAIGWKRYWQTVCLLPYYWKNSPNW